MFAPPRSLIPKMGETLTTFEGKETSVTPAAEAVMHVVASDEEVATHAPKDTPDDSNDLASGGDAPDIETPAEDATEDAELDSSEEVAATAEEATASDGDVPLPVTRNEELEIDVQVPLQDSILDESVSSFAEKHTVRQLKDICKKHGLQAVGKKIELANRILDYESRDSQDIVVIP